VGWRSAPDVLRSSVRAALAGHLTDVAASLAYYGFLAIPAMLLVAVGAFGVLAGPDTIQSLLDRLDGVVPDAALSLIDDSLTRITESSGSGAGLALVGLLLALWTSSGAMSALMRGLNRVHGCEETRSFAQQRLTALALLAWSLLAIAISFGLLVLGAPLSRALGDALDARTLVGWLWWGAQWPILGAALLAAVVGILRVGPARSRRCVRAELAGGAVAVMIWVVASAGFGVYVSGFGNYGAAWGSLSAVIVMLTWLWLTAAALLLGAQVEAEVERRAH
jgi:membrane protein